MPVLILAGDEEFELSRRAEQLKNSLLDPNWATVNFLRLTNPPIPQIVDQAASLPFGPGERVVVIDRCDLFTKKRGKTPDADEKESKSKDKGSQIELLEEALSQVHPHTHLIFACPYNFDSTLKTSKAAAKHAKLETFAKEKYYAGSRNPKLESWCRKEAKLHGATIDDDAVSYLLDGTEADLREISSELEKAAVHILPQRHITRDLVVKLSPYHSHLFVLADNWIKGRAREALASAEELLSRQSAMPIIAALQTMLSKWILMRALCEKYNSELPSGPGLDRRQLPLPDQVRKVAQELKLMPIVVEKDLKRIANVPTQTLIARRLELTRLEDAVKSGQLPESHALQLFLAG